MFTPTVEVADHEHFISFMLFAIAKLAFLLSRRTKARHERDIGTWLMAKGMRTVFELTSGLHNLSCRHPHLLLYQAI